jgi:hypothetical protein
MEVFMKKVLFGFLFIGFAAFLPAQVSFQLAYDPFLDVEEAKQIRLPSSMQGVARMMGPEWAAMVGIDLNDKGDWPAGWVDKAPGWLAGVGALGYGIQYYPQYSKSTYRTAAAYNSHTVTDLERYGYRGASPAEYYIPAGSAAAFGYPQHYYKPEQDAWRVEYYWNVHVQKTKFDPLVSTGINRWFEHLGAEGVGWLYSSPLPPNEWGRAMEYRPGWWFVNVTAGIHKHTGDIYVYMWVRDGDAPVARTLNGNIMGERGSGGSSLHGYYLSAYYKNNFNAGN